MHVKQQYVRLAACLLLAGCAVVGPHRPDGASRNGTSSIQWLGEGGFAVHVFGRSGSTQEDMGRRAMLEACRTSLGRGFSYYGVNNFETNGGVRSTETRSAGHDYVLNSTGQAVGAIYRPAEYGSSEYGNAILTVTTLSPGSITLLGGSMEIVDANTCLVHSRPTPE